MTINIPKSENRLYLEYPFVGVGVVVWKENHFNAVGFPKVFYITYHGYSKYFPNWALSRYQNLKKGKKSNRILGL